MRGDGLAGISRPRNAKSPQGAVRRAGGFFVGEGWGRFAGAVAERSAGTVQDVQATNRPLGEVEVIRYVTVNPTNGSVFRYVTLAVFPLRNYNYNTDNETEPDR